MTFNEAYDELVRRAGDLIEFKRQRLSLIHGNSPIMNLGSIDDEMISPLREYILAMDTKAQFPSRSFSFLDMSEIWVGGALNPTQMNPAIRKVMEPVLPTIRRQICEGTNQDLMMMRAVIKTFDSNALILPHCDDFTSHQISIRTHVPIMMTSDAIGINWHPQTFKPSFWRTPVGSFFAFNNFEPHSLVKLNPGSICCDLVVDFMPANLYRSANHAEFMALRQAADGHAPGFSEAENLHGITHSLSSLTVRNRLLEEASTRSTSSSMIT